MRKLLALVLLSLLAFGQTFGKTIVGIRGDQFYINAKPTYEGRYWKGYKIEGLLINSRMVQGVFDDLNPETVQTFAYPDTKKWDPDRNNREFVAAMPEWKSYGMNCFTINMQGGSPSGYGASKCLNPGFNKDGSLMKPYMQRLDRILKEADKLQMVVILGFFYFGQDQNLTDETAIVNATKNMTNWLLEKDYRNVLIEITNETYKGGSYFHPILFPDRIHELIEMVKGMEHKGHRLLVGTSFGGRVVPTSNVVKSSDFLLIHGNGAKQPDQIQKLLDATRKVEGYRLMPVLINEDDHYDFDKDTNNFTVAIKNYCSWGYFDFRFPGETDRKEGYQSVPVDWGIRSERKKAFFNKVKEITGSDTIRDLYADTWVASDALGRKMPDISMVGPLKTDKRRVVSIFYITWHTKDKHKAIGNGYTGDVTKVLSADPAARLDAAHPLWKEKSFHWGEPEMGYFLSQDEYVIRKDMSMLADAGVDLLVMDVTNAVRYWSEWEVLFTTMQKMKAEGNKVPQFCFWAFNGPVVTVVQDLYDRIYKTNRFSDLWFYWDGKPLMLYNGTPKFDANGKDVKQPNPHFDAAAKTDVNHPHYGDPDYSEEFYKDYTKEVKSTFTLRTMWWGYYQWAGQRFVGTEDNWSFGYDLGNEKVKAMDPDDLVSLHNGKKEEVAVTPAQHPSSLVGKSWRRETGEPLLNQYDLPDSAYVPWLGKTVKNPEGYGIYFQDRWEEALKSDPEMLYINDWNEWTAGKYPPRNAKFFPFMRRESSYFFVDQYNAEFNRCIQPMKEGYTDNYYMQMAQNIRHYKGTRPVPVQKGITAIKIDGQFADWKKVVQEFRDTKGDVIHRNFDGYGGLHYTNESGRNDIITCKVAVDKKQVNFYAETAGNLTPSDGNNWMLLLIDADNNPSTGWHGYDFLVNKTVRNENNTTLMRYDPSNPDQPWVILADLKYSYAGNELEVAVPRKLLGLTGDKFTFDFKWSDNPSGLKDPISLCTEGDTAPNRRFNYRCMWER